MDSTIIIIILGYVILAFLLLIFSMRTSFHWFLKTTMIVVLTFFYITTYKSFNDLLGWPTKDSLPDRFRLIAAQIYEPNIVINSEGSIYIWITNMNEKSGLSTPRSLEIPYSKEIHQKISKALVNIKNGVPQMGEMSDDNNEEGIVAKILEKKKAVSNSIKVNFFDMPSQLLPEK